MMGLRTARILVTGGIGFVQSSVAEQLVQPGVPQAQISVSRWAQLYPRFRYNYLALPEIEWVAGLGCGRLVASDHRRLLRCAMSSCTVRFSA